MNIHENCVIREWLNLCREKGETSEKLFKCIYRVFEKEKGDEKKMKNSMSCEQVKSLKRFESFLYATFRGALD